MARALGLDLGEKNIGVAVTDPLRMFAQPHDVWRADQNWLQRLKDFVAEYDVDTVVVGYPISMKGTETPQTVWTEKQIQKIKPVLEGACIVVKSDERLTTKESDRLLIDAGLKRKERKIKRNAIAAALILDKYLRRTENKKKLESASTKMI